MADLIQTDPREYVYEFNQLNELFDWQDSKDFITKCKNLNIYTDVAPFKETAVVIKNEANQGISRSETVESIDKHSYINACYIKSAFKESNPRENQNDVWPFGLIIATQGPQNNTLDSFWKMVVQNNVKKIVTLCNKIGNNRDADAV